jgi:tetratricopeptide (TPR) repeat protein/DNA-binding winged helix-turn-helix (wHTH) protein/TolB-like protein
MKLDDTLRKEFRLGDWIVRPIEGVVLGANESRHLQPKTMDVLVTLAESSGQVLTRDELIRRVWGANAVSDEPLTRCIHELRRVLDDDRGEPRFIQTIPKRGYRLLAEVRSLRTSDEIRLEDSGEENPLREVTRQRVLWVGLGYGSLAWLFIQLARFAEQQADAQQAPPEWLLPVFIIILLLGFPVAVFFAWIQQLKFDGFGAVFADVGSLHCMRSLLWSRRGIDMVLVTLVISLLAGFALDLVPLSKDGHEGPAQSSIAVLPFSSNSDADGNWLGKGIAEDVHDYLRTGDELAVSSISGSFRPSINELPVQQIGHELNVQYVLRGLIIRGDKNLRIKAYLIDTVTGIEVWSAAVYEDVGGLFRVEMDIANGVREFLGVVALAADLQSMPETINMAAYENYLRGRNSLRDASSATAAAEAARWFSQALAIDEQIPMARNGLCQAYVMELEFGGSEGIYGKANSACAEAILRSPGTAAAHLALGDFYRVSGHPAEAVAEYLRVTTLEAGNASAWYGLARAYAGSGSVGDAEQAFQQVLELKPDCADAHEAYVTFLLDQGRYGDALGIARSLVRLDSDRANGYEHLARALFMNGKFSAAIKASREVLRRDIDHRGAVMTIARSYYFLGRYQNAINIYAQAAKIVPDDHRAYGGLASAYAQRGDKESKVAARQNFARARYLAERDLLIDDENVNVMINLAYYCAALDDAGCARRHLAEALEIAPGNVWVHYVAALVHVRSGNMQAANRAAQRALALGYPQALIVTDPLLASTWSERHLVRRRFTALFVPIVPTY